MTKAMRSGGRTQVRFARFLVVGGTSFLVQIGTLKELLLLSFNTNVAFSVSFLCSTATHYTLNRVWALPSARADHLRQFKEYVGTALLSYGINFGIFHLCVDVLSLSRLWAAIIAIPPSTLVVFLLLNYRVFRASAP